MTMSSSSKPPTGEERIDDFDPDREGSSANGWLQKVETFARENHLSDDQTYSFALGKLNGEPKEWLSRSKVTGWQAFRQAFVVAFPEPASDRTRSRHRTMERRKRTPKESVHGYIEEMVTLGKRLKLSEPTIVRRIVLGLDDPVLEKAIPRGMGLQQLLKALEWQEEVEGLLEQYGASKVTVDGFERLADEMESFVLDGGHESDVPVHGDAEVMALIADELNSLVRRNRASLSCGLFDLGTCKTHQIVVNLLQDACALIDSDKTTRRRVPARETQLKGSWQTSVISLLACDVIQKSASSSRVQPAHHVDSELLLDLSHLNAICCREPANLLLPQQLLPALSAFRYFTVLDFNGGHLQIPLAPHGPTRSYLSFDTPFGAFQFQRAPRNFANTTIIFNKILIELARKLSSANADDVVVVVLNDVLVVPGRDIADGLQKLARVLPALAAFGLTADLHRSRFFLPSVQLFNWTVRHGKVISNGLPFEPSGHSSAGRRLTLLIKLSDDATTCRALLQLRAEDNTLLPQTIGRFLGGTSRDSQDGTGVPDRNALLVEHLGNAIEHFRQFLLFISFDVVLDSQGSLGTETEVKRKLLKVQQFDFKLVFGEESD